MFDRLQVIEERFEELNRMLMDPAIGSDVGRLREVSKEHADLRPVVEGWRKPVMRTESPVCRCLQGRHRPEVLPRSFAKHPTMT